MFVVYLLQNESHGFQIQKLPFLFLLKGGVADTHSCNRTGGEAKFWIEPVVELAKSFGISHKEISELIEIIKSHENEIRKAWKKHF
jgi:hypothetical protein